MLVTPELLQRFRAAEVFFSPRVKALGETTNGWLRLGQRLRLRRPVRIESRAGLYGGPYQPSKGGQKSGGLFAMGSFSYSYSALHEQVSVGRYCSISSGLTILDSHHPLTMVTTSAAVFRPRTSIFRGFVPKTVRHRYPFEIKGPKPYPVIEHDVWIGRDVTLGMGVRIGTGSVVAAGSVVTKDVAPYTIVGGNPAKVIRRRLPDAVCDLLLASAWWRYAPDVVLGTLPADDPERFCLLLGEAEAAGRVSPFDPPAVLLEPAADEPGEEGEAEDEEE